MGRQSERNRSAPNRPTDATIEHLVVVAARLAFGAGEHQAAFDRAVRALTDIEGDPDPPRRPSAVVATLLHRGVTAMYESGWQPADIAHAVRRHWTMRASRLIVTIIASEARSTDAVHRAPPSWLAQLQDLGVYDPARTTIVGGHEHAFDRWVRAERLDPDEALAIALQVLAQVTMSPRQAALIDPPSAWGASNRGGPATPPPSRGDIDAKTLTRIRALLAKAEATTFEAEAESFTAKAQEMMTRYSIDAAVLASAGAGPSTGSGIESRRVHIDSPYADEKVVLLSVIADVNAARCVWSPQAGFATVVGYPVDLHLTDLLFTSLLVQATRASAEATSADRRLRTPSFRRAFMIAFADRIGERLAASRQRAAAEAEQQYSPALVPILADREAAVTEAFTHVFPDVKPMRNRRLDAHGWHAGRTAADRAHLGTGAAIAPT